MADIIKPYQHALAEARRDPAHDPTCPAAKLGRYADSGNQYLLCGVERKHFAVNDSPLAVKGWCCGEYTQCPVWIAAKTNDPALERSLAAAEREVTDAQTKRQIETGLRVDDSEVREVRKLLGDDA